MSATQQATTFDTTSLSLDTLGSLDTRVAVPSYNPADTETGIVHLGFGGFHRAHMALYTHKLMERDFAANKGWGIAGVGLMPNDKKMQEATKLYEQAAATKPQDAMERLDVEMAQAELEE